MTTGTSRAYTRRLMRLSSWKMPTAMSLHWKLSGMVLSFLRTPDLMLHRNSSECVERLGRAPESGGKRGRGSGEDVE